MEDLLIPHAAGADEHPFGFTKTGRPRRVYKCRDCARVFKRSEHCARHERVHTRERPFACRFCSKKYARKDLVTRHERSLHPDETAAAGDFRSRRSSHSASTVSSHSNPQRHAPPPARHNPSESASPDDLFSQHGPPTPQDLGGAVRRNSYPITFSRMMSPSFFSGVGFPSLDADPPSRGPDEHGPDASPAEHQVEPLHSSPEKPFAFQHGAADLGPSPMDIAAEHMAFDTAVRPSDAAQTQAAGHDADLQPAGQDLLLDSDFFLGQTAQTLPEGVPFEVLRDLYSIPGSPLAIPQPPSFPYTMPQVPSLPMTGMSPPNGAASRTLPRVMREKVTSPPKLAVDDAVHESLCRDLRGRLKDKPDTSAIPRGKELERLMETYITCFHCHYPIIHFASLDLATAPGPLVLSICAIGALYRLDRRRAVAFHNLASSSLHSAVSSRPSTSAAPASARPLWVVQSCLLLSMYAAFSGQPAAVLSTVEKMGFFKIEFQLRRTALQKGTQESARLSWNDWILRESTKRLLCGIFIMSNLFCVTYGTTPVFSIDQDLLFEIPSEEKLWDARTAELWDDIIASRNASCQHITLREAIVTTLFDRQEHFGTAPAQISGFTALIITHAANVHMWNILQFVQSFAPPLANEILASTFSALLRWHTALGNGRVEAPETAYYSNAGIPLVFNCYALLRIAYVRLFGNGSIFNKMILLTDDLDEVSATMTSYVAAPQPRSHFLTKAISKAYEGFATPVKLGHLLIKKTAALSWSVEHAVAAWDSVLFVSKWVHALQMESATHPPDEEEERILTHLRGALDEMEYDFDSTGSLAAAVTRAWASFLTDTWVWGGEQSALYSTEFY
ncbi:hypothetical protein SLS56_009482 [Neofusicoccum ribis]|uniref:C2H2-type domain-containing protein n=1 Tax=Neofusicoccum ribis TaxID=45134 RepID=A0ABR3SH94_9PEZI